VLQKWDARAPLLTLNHLVVRAHPALGELLDEVVRDQPIGMEALRPHTRRSKAEAVTRPSRDPQEGTRVNAWQGADRAGGSMRKAVGAACTPPA